MFFSSSVCFCLVFFVSTTIDFVYIYTYVCVSITHTGPTTVHRLLCIHFDKKTQQLHSVEQRMHYECQWAFRWAHNFMRIEEKQTYPMLIFIWNLITNTNSIVLNIVICFLWNVHSNSSEIIFDNISVAPSICIILHLALRKYAFDWWVVVIASLLFLHVSCGECEISHLSTSCQYWKVRSFTHRSCCKTCKLKLEFYWIRSTNCNYGKFHVQIFAIIPS